MFRLKCENILVASWFLSPVLAGIASVSLYWFLHVKVVIPTQAFEKEQNTKGETLGLLLLPVFYGVTVFINIYALLHHQEGGGFLETVPYARKYFKIMLKTVRIEIRLIGNFDEKWKKFCLIGN